MSDDTKLPKVKRPETREEWQRMIAKLHPSDEPLVRVWRAVSEAIERKADHIEIARAAMLEIYAMPADGEAA